MALMAVDDAPRASSAVTLRSSADEDASRVAARRASRQWINTTAFTKHADDDAAGGSAVAKEAAEAVQPVEDEIGDTTDDGNNKPRQRRGSRLTLTLTLTLIGRQRRGSRLVFRKMSFVGETTMHQPTANPWRGDKQ